MLPGWPCCMLVPSQVAQHWLLPRGAAAACCRCGTALVWHGTTLVLQVGEELTYDYRFCGEEQLPCNCGAATCRGRVNEKPPNWDELVVPLSQLRPYRPPRQARQQQQRQQQEREMGAGGQEALQATAVPSAESLPPPLP